MRNINEGGKELIELQVSRRRGSGAITLTNPEYRILTYPGLAAAGTFGAWTAANWDSATEILYALFDSTQAGISSPGIYQMELRGTIGSELYENKVLVRVAEFGP